MCNPLTLNPSSSAADCLTQQNCDVDQPDRVQIVTSAAQVIPNLWAANGPDECQTDSSLLTPKMAPSSTQTLSSGMIKSAAGPGDTPSMVSVKERIAAENAAAQERATRAEKFCSRRTSSGTPFMLSWQHQRRSPATDISKYCTGSILVSLTTAAVHRLGDGAHHAACTSCL